MNDNGFVDDISLRRFIIGSCFLIVGTCIIFLFTTVTKKTEIDETPAQPIAAQDTSAPKNLINPPPENNTDDLFK